MSTPTTCVHACPEGRGHILYPVHEVPVGAVRREAHTCTRGQSVLRVTASGWPTTSTLGLSSPSSVIVTDGTQGLFCPCGAMNILSSGMPRCGISAHTVCFWLFCLWAWEPAVCRKPLDSTWRHSLRDPSLDAGAFSMSSCLVTAVVPGCASKAHMHLSLAPLASSAFPPKVFAQRAEPRALSQAVRSRGCAPTLGQLFFLEKFSPLVSLL